MYNFTLPTLENNFELWLHYNNSSFNFNIPGWCQDIGLAGKVVESSKMHSKLAENSRNRVEIEDVWQWGHLGQSFQWLNEKQAEMIKIKVK